MADQPQLPDIRQPFLDGPTNINRVWYRALRALKSQSGSTATPLVVGPNAIINEATLTSGGTISLADIPSGTLLGNSSGADGPAETQVVASSLSFEDGTLAVASIGPGTLSGNPGSTSAPPTAITPGTNLTLTAAGVLNATADAGDQTLLYSILDARAPVVSLTQRVAAIEMAAATIIDPRALIASLTQRVAILETLVAMVQDQRAQIASLQQQINAATTLAMHK